MYINLVSPTVVEWTPAVCLALECGVLGAAWIWFVFQWRAVDVLAELFYLMSVKEGGERPVRIGAALRRRGDAEAPFVFCVLVMYESDRRAHCHVLVVRLDFTLDPGGSRRRRKSGRGALAAGGPGRRSRPGPPATRALPGLKLLCLKF